MKLVINKCFGGFSLSPLAVKRLAELQGKECFFFDYKDTPLTLEEATGVNFFMAFSTPNLGDAVNPKKPRGSMTPKERKTHDDSYLAINLTTRPENRSDPLLIKVVEELGVEAASGKLAELAIVEIPDDVQYTIEDYDGRESVHEKHRSW